MQTNEVTFLDSPSYQMSDQPLACCMALLCMQTLCTLPVLLSL